MQHNQPVADTGRPGDPHGGRSWSSDRAWTQIEHQLVEEAAQAPLTNPVTTYAVSARRENVQINPQWGILLSRIRVQ